MINIPKGTKDILPNESYKWQKVREVIAEIKKRYNLKEISTPVFEHTELFVRGVGESSDIVNKEMYTFKDKGDRSITLKPEGTAGAVRSFVENGLFNEPLPLKMFYITPCFRYERPQAGRLRQHTQFGVELFGPDSSIADAEVINIMHDFYNAFGIDPTFKINNLGCKECNAKFKAVLKDYLTPKLSHLCPDCQRRYSQNPLRVLDCKVESCKEILKDAPTIGDVLCDTCKDRTNELTALLDSEGVKYQLDKKLVRGLDYYTGVVFEVVDIDKELGQNALGGGGRYNNLVEELGGKSTPVVGFGIGIERLLLYLESKNLNIIDNYRVDFYVASMTDNKNYIINLVKKLRDAGYGVECDLMGRSLKAQFKFADKLNARYVLTIGDNEIENKSVAIKNMESGVQEIISLNELIKRFVK